MKTRMLMLMALNLILLSYAHAQWNESGDNHTTGKVGIGTATPAIHAKLQLVGGTDAAMVCAECGYLVLGDVNSTNIVIDNNEIMAKNNGGVSNLGLQADGGSITVHGGSGFPEEQKVHISNTGEVGIGELQIPSGYKLAVNGKAIAEEVRVEMAGDGTGEWPDYVFQPNYPLLSLSELEQSIQQNGHLPNIPSAAEVEADGIELGDMNRRLLEKVEELTLYVIELKKEIDALKQQKGTVEKVDLH